MMNEDVMKMYKDLWYREISVICRYVLLEKYDGSCCIDFWNGDWYGDFLLFYNGKLKD